jgi:SAM-dependent methyltransferase
MAGTAEMQGPLWGARARDWAEVQEGTVRPLYESVLGKLDLEHGTRLLDAGCGTGLFAAMAAKEGASVSGLDASEASIAIAKERTPAGDFRVGEIEELPWDDGSFDVVTGFNSFQFAADPVNALRQARRVVRDDGRVVVAIWGREEDCEAVAVIEGITAFLPPPPPGTPGPFALSEPGALEALVEQAGLHAQEGHEVPCPWVYPNVDTAVRGLASAGPAIRAEQENGREAIEETIAQSLQPFRDALTGIVQLENVFRYLVTKPKR